MSPTLIAAVVTITAAAIFYTVAVFAERRAGVLVPWHLAMFWLGFAFDVTGTTLMSAVAGGWKGDIHGWLGVTAIVVMLVHCAWASIAILLKQESVLRRFHRFSLAVWALWMTSLLTGYALAVPRMLAKAAG